jgi:hypothetical protein
MRAGLPNISVQVFRPVSCAQCGYESDPRCRFCGICGAKLLQPGPIPLPEPASAEPALVPEHVPPRGHSHGLADEPGRSVAYLLEAEPRASHWGRWLVVIVLSAGIGAGAWQWRDDLRAWVAAEISEQPPSIQTQPRSSSATPTSNSSSEPAGTMLTAQPVAEKPTTESTPGQAEQSQSPANAAPQLHTEPEAEPNKKPSAVQPPVQPQPLSKPTATPTETVKQDESSSLSDASVEEVPSKPIEVPRQKLAQAAAPGMSVHALEVEGEKYLNGTGAPANCARAYRDLLAAAQRSSTKAESLLGAMYATGHCVTRDRPLAYHWFSKALQHEPANARLQQDVQVLWNQMTPHERGVVMHYR